MLKARNCSNCAAGNAKCKKPRVFSNMSLEEYKAVRNHLGRDMYKRHMDNIEEKTPQEKHRLRRALIGASMYWSEDPIEGSYGEINRMIEEKNLVAQIFVQLCKAICGIDDSYEEVEDLTRQLAPNHPVRLGVTLVHAHSHAKLLNHQEAISTAERGTNATAGQQLTEEASKLHQILSENITSWKEVEAIPLTKSEWMKDFKMFQNL